MSSEFIRRICTWNSQRYDREAVQELTAHLLYEECHEYDASTDDLNRLDGLVDIVYVAIGAMWKMGLSPDEIAKAIEVVCDSNATKSITKTASNQKANEGDKGINYIPPTNGLMQLLEMRSCIHGGIKHRIPFSICLDCGESNG